MCSIENVEYWEDNTIMYAVDSEGEPTQQIDHTETGDFNCYHCKDCGEEFQEWEDVLTHVGEEDYAHCRGCDKVINLDKDSWHSDGNDTFCDDCWEKENE